MQIDCPSCGAAYQVPETVVAAGRMVRCARCGKDWAPGGASPQSGMTAEASPDEAMVQEAAGVSVQKQQDDRSDTSFAEAPALQSHAPGEPGPQPAAAPSVEADGILPTPSKAARKPVIYAWAASVVFIAVLGMSAVAWRVPVMHAWPPSTRLYAAIHMG